MIKSLLSNKQTVLKYSVLGGAGIFSITVIILIIKNICFIKKEKVLKVLSQFIGYALKKRDRNMLNEYLDVMIKIPYIRSIQVEGHGRPAVKEKGDLTNKKISYFVHQISNGFHKPAVIKIGLFTG